jgi:transcription initiation factor TFIIIB Brf1 subunit/transcription initiation factor TFIIB
MVVIRPPKDVKHVVIVCSNSRPLVTKFVNTSILQMDNIQYIYILSKTTPFSKQNKIKMTTRCTDCGSFDLVEDYSDGSLVCRKCGLVVCPWLLDQRPLFDHCRNVHSTPYVSSENQNNIVLDGLDKLWPGIDMRWVAESVSKMIENDEQRGRNKAARTAVAVYKVLQNNRNFCVSLETICTAFEADVKLVRAMFTNNVVDIPINQRIVRLANDMLIDGPQRMQVIRTASDIEERLKNDISYMSKKPSKMDAVIFYLVCTEKLGLKIKKNNIVKLSDISSVTFNKHLDFLQSSLAKLGYIVCQQNV